MIGHAEVRTQLEAHLPPVVLVRGPRSVGKRTLGIHLLSHHGAQKVDRLEVLTCNVEQARLLRDFFSTAPMGKIKGAVVRLDGASEQSLNALLKLLEEPPPSGRFVLTSAGTTLATVESRSVLVRVGLLHQSEVESVLRSRGYSDGAAVDAARLGDGTVFGAMSGSVDESARASVLSVLKAVADRDRERLELAVHGWSDDAHALLRVFAIEARTGRWRVFAPTDSFGLAKDVAAITGLVHDLSRSARPRLAARYALYRALQRKEVS